MCDLLLTCQKVRDRDQGGKLFGQSVCVVHEGARSYFNFWVNTINHHSFSYAQDVNPDSPFNSKLSLFSRNIEYSLNVPDNVLALQSGMLAL